MSQSELIPLQLILNEYKQIGRSGLLPALLAAQKQFGFLSPSISAEIGRTLGVPLAEVYGVIEFYSMLTTNPDGKTSVQVCCDAICALQGADRVFEALQQHCEVSSDDGGHHADYHVERVACLGLCNHAPAVKVGEIAVGKADPGNPETVFLAEDKPLIDHVDGSLRILTPNCCRPEATSLDEYRHDGGYEGLTKALSMAPSEVLAEFNAVGLSGMPPTEVIAEVNAAGLLGRGGAAFPAGAKWEGVSKAPGDIKYVVCNADESEPGSFKDRFLLEMDPHRTLEGLIIAAYAVGAKTGYIYIRGEYHRALAEVKTAVEAARQAGLIGKNIMGSGFDFEVEIRQGAGAYICGEETALFESIEGKRGFPRIKPPYPTTHGLFGRPTVINNVETLCNLPFIITTGSENYRKIGTARSTGPKLFCVSGDVQRPGLYEVPFGITLRELLFDLAGGIRKGHKLKTVLLGGAAGSFAVEKDLDVRLSFEDLRAAGLSLGSGAVMVLDDSRDLRDVLRRVTHFFADESCGKCYPCQIGTQRQFEIMNRVAGGTVLPGDAGRLADLGWTMTDASLCGLGQTAGLAVLSALEQFPELFSPAQADSSEQKGI
jgi:NADH-quinone oxidoreductase subunit F